MCACAGARILFLFSWMSNQENKKKNKMCIENGVNKWLTDQSIANWRKKFKDREQDQKIYPGKAEFVFLDRDARHDHSPK